MDNCEAEDISSNYSYPSSLSIDFIDPEKAFNFRSYKRERDAPFFTDYLQSDDSHFDSDCKKMKGYDSSNQLSIGISSLESSPERPKKESVSKVCISHNPFENDTLSDKVNELSYKVQELSDKVNTLEEDNRKLRNLFTKTKSYSNLQNSLSEASNINEQSISRDSSSSKLYNVLNNDETSTERSSKKSFSSNTDFGQFVDI